MKVNINVQLDGEISDETLVQLVNALTKKKRTDNVPKGEDLFGKMLMDRVMNKPVHPNLESVNSWLGSESLNTSQDEVKYGDET